MQQALWLTAKVALFTLVLHLFAGLTLGYALAKPNWRGRDLLDLLIAHQAKARCTVYIVAVLVRKRCWPARRPLSRQCAVLPRIYEKYGSRYFVYYVCSYQNNSNNVRIDEALFTLRVPQHL